MEGQGSQEEEEIVLFMEDRRPGNVSLDQFKPNKSKFVKESEVGQKSRLVQIESEDYIQISSYDGSENETKEDVTDCSKTESSTGTTELNLTNTSNEEALTPEMKEKLGEDFLLVEEDRNPFLTGQESQSPRYTINQNFLKLHEPKPAKRNKLANPCWNCGDTSHALRDCQEPRNHQEINRNRQEFQQSKINMPVYKRYHKEESQVFSHLVPGELSEELRRAMGLDARELPPHIYHMRRLGYPPGWLLEAKISHSGITMFDGQGKAVAQPGTEVGEVVEQGSLDKYDARKIIRYPGFNCSPPPDTYDDSEYYKCPRLSRYQSVEAMLERLGSRLAGGYKRRKLSFNDTMTELDESSQSVESQDMEYEETPEGAELPADNCKFVPPLPEQALPPPPPDDVPDEPVDTDPDSQSLLSAPIEENSLTELEEQKKLLLAQLNDVSQVVGTPEGKIGKVKTIEYGTPIIKSVSPFARLPSAEKFSVDICDVINFENLPDSTGKYQKMSGLIHKVRVKLSEINNEL